ncbi:MAG: hypothetical protein JJ974_03265 [Phycisphaerales bacterium]|nr:hypothetical protein [Phycisphaerales bacterium]
MQRTVVYWTLILFMTSVSASFAQSESDNLRRSLLVAQQEVEPTVTIRWLSKTGPRVLKGTLPYGPPMGGEVLNRVEVDSEDAESTDASSNIRAYMALGGSRVDTGAGHPKGVVVRVGLTKVDSARPFFAKIVPGTSVVIELEGVALTQPVKFHEGTALMHMKYAIGDLEACSLPGTARNQYLLSHPDDTLAGRVTEGLNATRGAFEDRGAGMLHGDFRININENEDGAERVGFRFEVPYGMFRHLQDPWDSVLPGTFFEPIHLHAEVEMLPLWATPIDLSQIVDTEAEVRNETNEPRRLNEEAVDEPTTDSEIKDD